MSTFGTKGAFLAGGILFQACRPNIFAPRGFPTPRKLESGKAENAYRHAVLPRASGSNCAVRNRVLDCCGNPYEPWRNAHLADFAENYITTSNTHGGEREARNVAGSECLGTARSSPFKSNV